MWKRVTRDSVLFLVGLLGVTHETLLATSERPTLLLLFAAMMGLPVILSADERRRERYDLDEIRREDRYDVSERRREDRYDAIERHREDRYDANERRRDELER